MFIESKELLTRIKKVSDIVKQEVSEKIEFVEYITLPYYGGNIILRFKISDKNYSFEDIDEYEQKIQNIVHDDFLIDFLGEVYQNIGVNYNNIENKFIEFSDKYKNIIVTQSPFNYLINNDVKSILRKCGMDSSLRIWEIQYEEEISIFILGKSDQKVDEVTIDKKKYNLYEVDKVKCEGLIKATFFAKKHKTSLARLLLEE